MPHCAGHRHCLTALALINLGQTRHSGQYVAKEQCPGVCPENSIAWHRY